MSDITNKRTVIPPEYYTSESLFEVERERLFNTTWQFFCFKADLKNENDFVTREIAGIPVVVHNVNGQIAAFLNVCSHRFSPVQAADKGNRRLICPYHGWQYNNEGYPVGIPHNLAFYPIAEEEKKHLCLQQFPVELCGNLVFVRINPDGLSLKEQMGEWWDLLSDIGQSIDDIYFHHKIEAHCNWKLLIHNVFDDIHAEFVHPVSSLDPTGYVHTYWEHHPFEAEQEDLHRDYALRHAKFNVEYSDDCVQYNINTYSRYWPIRHTDKIPGYLHLYLWPNALITSHMGYWFNFVHYHPISPDKTDIYYWLLPARQTSALKQGSDKQNKMLTQYMDEILNFEKIGPDFLFQLATGSLKIFMEDIRAVEGAQNLLSSVSKPGILGQRENKLYEFERAYYHLLTTERQKALI